MDGTGKGQTKRSSWDLAQTAWQSMEQILAHSPKNAV